MTPAQAQALNKKFVADVSRFVAAAKGNADQVVRKVLFDLSAAIVMRTPVDTGRLRGNWQFGEDKVPEGTLPDTSSIERLRADIAPVGAGHVHYLVNNLLYAPVIEYGLYPNPSAGTKTSGGYSTQAPAGMLRVTVLEYKQYLDKAVQELR